jgi:nijmegen breakage syndrome protein 1
MNLTDILAALTSSQPIQSNQPAPVTTPAQEEMPPPETSRRARSRRARGQVRSFLDDDFSGPLVMHSIPEAAEVDPSPAPPVEEPESQGLFVSQDPETQVRREPSQPPEPITQSKKRRPASIFSEDEDVMEVLAPTTAAIKRRRLAEELDRKRRGESTPPPPPPTPPVIKKEALKADPVKPPAKKPRKVKELSPDPIEEARIRREEAEAAAQAEREFLEAQFDGMNIEDIRKKIVIEEIEVKRAQPPPRPVAHADESERWEDKWNGRKNFKRFRRRGADNSQRIDKVIVALEEVKNRNYGIGDEYWESGGNNMQRKKDKGHDTQDSGSRPQSRVAAEPEQNESDSGSNDLPIISQHKPSVGMNSSDESELEIMSKPVPKVTMATSSRNSQKLVDKTRESRNVSVEPVNKKRPAPAMMAKAPPAKKMRQTNAKPIGRQESDDESDDGLKFKLRRKR